MNYKFHPLADVLPLIEGAEFDQLVADIAKNGLLNPITIHDDMVLDGRNRDRACRAAGAERALAEGEKPRPSGLSARAGSVLIESAARPTDCPPGPMSALGGSGRAALRRRVRV